MSSYTGFASINELEAGEEGQSLDYGFPSTIQTTGSGTYTSSIQTIFSRHATDIRASAEPILQPLHQISKRRIRELVAAQNKDLFGFFQHPERSPSALGIAETIFRKYGHDLPVTQRTMSSISRELNLDVSMNAAITAIESAMDKACAPGSSSSSIHQLTTQLKWIFGQYKQAGDEVMRLEALLNQKTEVLDRLHQRTPLITNLTTNEALTPLLDAFHVYMKEVFESNKFEETYKDLAEAYKKWHVLREIVTVQQLSGGGKEEPLCAVCLTDPVAHAIVPCGHTFCAGCVRRIGTSCFLCRTAVREKIRLFFT